MVIDTVVTLDDNIFCIVKVKGAVGDRSVTSTLSYEL
jgi:hypothetical protein